MQENVTVLPETLASSQFKVGGGAVNNIPMCVCVYLNVCVSAGRFYLPVVG